jgi:hypothetical protein
MPCRSWPNAGATLLSRNRLASAGRKSPGLGRPGRLPCCQCHDREAATTGYRVIPPRLSHIIGDFHGSGLEEAQELAPAAAATRRAGGRPVRAVVGVAHRHPGAHVRRLPPQPRQRLHELGRRQVRHREPGARASVPARHPGSPAGRELPPADRSVARAELPPLAAAPRVLSRAQPSSPPGEHRPGLLLHPEAGRGALGAGGDEPLLRNPSDACRIGGVDRRAQGRALRLLLPGRADRVSRIPGFQAPGMARGDARRVRAVARVEARRGHLPGGADAGRRLPRPTLRHRRDRREGPLLRPGDRRGASHPARAEGRGRRRRHARVPGPLESPLRRLRDGVLRGEASRAPGSLRDLSLSGGGTGGPGVLRRVRRARRPSAGRDLPVPREPGRPVRPRVLPGEHRPRAPVRHRRPRADGRSLYLSALRRALLRALLLDGRGPSALGFGLLREDVHRGPSPAARPGLRRSDLEALRRLEGFGHALDRYDPPLSEPDLRRLLPARHLLHWPTTTRL